MAGFIFAGGGSLTATPIISTGSTTGRTLPDRLADVANVKDFGATGDGSTDDRATIQLAINAVLGKGGGTVYFPRPSAYYLIGAKLTFTGSSGAPCISLVGERPDVSSDNTGSYIVGNFNDYLCDGTPTNGQAIGLINCLGFHNYHATGSGLYLPSQQSAKISNCIIQAYKGIVVGPNNYCLLIETTSFNSGRATGSIGVVGSQTLIQSCNFQGWDIGVALTNTGGGVKNSRFEVCRTGVLLGDDGTSAFAGCSGVGVEDNQFERCSTGIYGAVVSGGNIIGNVVTGTVGPDAADFVTNALTSAGVGSKTLHFASVDAGITIGQFVGNKDHITSIPLGAKVASKTAITVVLDTDVAAPGVSSGDDIVFASTQAKLFLNTGMELDNITGCLISGNVTGIYDTACVKFNGNVVNSMAAALNTSNGYGSNKWIMPSAANAAGLTCIQCDKPNDLFANLPSSPVNGSQFTISDGATTSIGAAVTQGIGGDKNIYTVCRGTGGWIRIA